MVSSRLGLVALVVANHGISFVRNFLGRRGYARLSVATLIFWPYARMSVVALVLAVGLGVAQLWPGARGATAFALFMVLVKTAADAASHVAEHGWLQRRNRALPDVVESHAGTVVAAH